MTHSRLSAEQTNELLTQIKSEITKIDTVMRDAASAHLETQKAHT